MLHLVRKDDPSRPYSYGPKHGKNWTTILTLVGGSVFLVSNKPLS